MKSKNIKHLLKKENKQFTMIRETALHVSILLYSTGILKSHKRKFKDRIQHKITLDFIAK